MRPPESCEGHSGPIVPPRWGRWEIPECGHLTCQVAWKEGLWLSESGGWTHVGPCVYAHQLILGCPRPQF